MADRENIEEARRRHREARARQDAARGDEAWKTWQTSAADHWVALNPQLRRLQQMDGTNEPTIESMRQLASHIESAMDPVPNTWRIDSSLPDEFRDVYAAQVGWWHQLMHGLYGPIDHAMSTARNGHRSGIELLVRFLEAEVYCDRSGYYKADVVRTITRVELDPANQARLQRVVLAVVDVPDRREFRAYIRLARHVQSATLLDALELRHASSDRRIARHARWMLDGLRAGGPRPPLFEGASSR
jgi:hypothetical protein